jgi:hypothetical protein
MTNRQTALPIFDEPTLSDIYMSDIDDDDDDLSDESIASSTAEGLFPIQHTPQQNDSLIAEMPAKSLSMIQTMPSPVKTPNRHRHKTQHRMRSSRHSYRRQQPSPGEDPPGYEASSTLDLARFIYTLPDVHEEEPSKASTMPKDRKSTDPIDPYVQQRRLHLCVIFLTFMFLLLGITVAVIGSTIYQEEEVPTATAASAALEQEGGSLPAVPIDLPDNFFRVRPPSLSPSRGAASLPSVWVDTIAPTAMPSLRVSEATPPVAPSSMRPTVRPTPAPVIQSTEKPSSPPILEPLEVQVSPPSRAPTRAPVTARPTPVRSFAPIPRRSQWTETPVDETFEPTVAGKKPKGEKRH